MFDTPVEAKQVIEERFAPDLAELVAGQLRPAIVFSARDGAPGANVGGSRIGGAPDLPENLEWPRRPVPENADEIAKRGGEPYAAELREHLMKGLPYAFFAQVDLTAAAGLGDVAKDLPGEGRLLFFYDLIAGPYDSGTQSARVIWDRSPATEVKAATMPQPLAAAATAYRRMMDEITGRTGSAPAAAETGMPQPGTPYGGPAREMTLGKAWQLPTYTSIEFQTSGRLLEIHDADRQAIGGDQEFSQTYGELSDEYAARAQIFGAPVPEQDDPRYDAVVVRDHKVQHLSGDDWKNNRDAILKTAEDWTLLFQIGVTEWMQESGEGTLYFLIRHEDLKSRAFDKVVAVYQQT